MAARRGKTQARRNSGNGTPGWVWLIAGVAIAAVVFMAAPGLFKKNGDGFLRVGGPRANPDAQPAPVADTDADAAPELPRPAAATGSAKPEAKKNAQTQYDFYTLLPGKEVQMSDAELAASARAEAARQARAPQAAAATAAASNPTPLPETAPAGVPGTPAAAAATPAMTTPATPGVAPAAATTAPDSTRYMLQAGSFGASGDAESTKAKLAMLGLSARVESVQIGRKTVYRVRMGPYGTASELAEAKQRLTGSGVPAIAIKAQ
ncbi:SPOR domain-containing protein [Xanthomonas theicola]|uniref:Sporulation protein n=1 Tax=Xanthomonas theicola TaxID=56464 RepID=A0A2S6ZF34_9XANT|nr:SPOR domain-containing protein [Xanthomonas theicola]PPT90875.1 sporulation protein [Xanthomonas theicola]QNH26657.1 sporulation protein [Xanthomonas theicola]